ncbi:MAG: 2-oxo acid dehydrogenase subunit E2 [Desulfobacterales bacterium]|nr:MAG: 2-oxo acid dehydrogenase subunit E2 [Desulfobacterales bacterium]
MALPINIPKLGMTMELANLVEWKFSEGDWVEKDRVVLAIETEKISWEVPAVGSGYLHIIVEIGNKAKVGAVVGLLCPTQEELAEVQKQLPPAAAMAAKPVPATAATARTAAVPLKTAEKPPAPSSPAARRLAKELNVDLSGVTGTGPGGRITEADVRRFYEEGPPRPKITPLAEEVARQAGLDIMTIQGTGNGGTITKEDVARTLAAGKTPEPSAPVRAIPFTGMRKSIADNLYASLHNTAQLTTFTEVDATEMVRFRDLVREEYKNDDTVRISYNDILIMATARALKRFPIMNSNLVGDEILLFEAVHMGIAVALPEGLIVPVLKHADKMNLLEIARGARDLAHKARAGTLTVDEVTGGTFTISNTSMFPVDGATPILKPPETAILGISRLREKPAVYQGAIAIRTMMVLSLTFDHRVADGAPAAEFVGTVARYIENPSLILA